MVIYLLHLTLTFVLFTGDHLFLFLLLHFFGFEFGNFGELSHHSQQ